MENLSFSPDDSSSTKENVNLRHYWHVVLERRWLVITAFVSVFILSLIYLYKAPRIYEAIARMEIAPEAENVLNLKEVLSIAGQDLDYRQTQFKNLKSRTLINSVISQLHLERDPRYAKQRDIHRAVEGDIQIVPIRLSRLVDIKVQHPNPQTGAKIANTLVRQFIDDNLTLRRDKWNKMAKFLHNEAEGLKVEVESADRALAKYRKEKKSVSLEDRQNIDLQSLMLARTDLSKAQSESAVAQTNAAEVTRWEEEGGPLENIPQVAEDISIKDLQNKLAVEKTKLESLLARYKSKWPQVQESRALIAQLSTSINERAIQIIAAIKKKAESLRTNEEILEDQIRQEEKKILEDQVRQEEKRAMKLGGQRIDAERLSGTIAFATDKTKDTRDKVLRFKLLLKSGLARMKHILNQQMVSDSDLDAALDWNNRLNMQLTDLVGSDAETELQLAAGVVTDQLNELGVALENARPKQERLNGAKKARALLEGLIGLLPDIDSLAPTQSGDARTSPPGERSALPFQSQNENVFTITITSDGRYFCEGKPMSLREIASRLRQAHTKDQDLVLSIRAERDLEIAKVRALIDAAAEQKIRQVLIATP
jgi:uncharacterized protein involved in exopolysaccharide biosynthesis/biopolymer transport protein ExbD